MRKSQLTTSKGAISLLLKYVIVTLGQMFFTVHAPKSGMDNVCSTYCMYVILTHVMLMVCEGEAGAFVNPFQSSFLDSFM